MQSIVIGIVTILLYAVLKERDAETMIRALESRKGLIQTHDNPRVDTYEYISYLYADKGAILTISKFNDSPWGLYVYLNPAQVLGSSDGLYRPDPKSYKQLHKTVDHMLSKIKAPHGLKDMKLSRVSVAVDLEMNKRYKVAAYLGILRQGFLPRHYANQPLQEDEVVSDAQYVSEHFYRQSCKTTTFSVCDQVALNNLNTGLPLPQMGRKTLRLQIDLRRKAIRRKLKRKDREDHCKALMKLTEQADEIVTQQLRRMKLLNGCFLPYGEAVDAVSSKIKGEKARERMLFLLEKVLDTGNLTTAVYRLKQHFDLSNRKANRLLRKFRDLGISPVTLQDSAKKSLPGLGALLEDVSKQ